jgi:hypothetical protein
MIDRSESRLIAAERKNKRRRPQRAGGNDRPSPQDQAKNKALPTPKSA